MSKKLTRFLGEYKTFGGIFPLQMPRINTGHQRTNWRLSWGKCVIAYLWETTVCQSVDKSCRISYAISVMTGRDYDL